MCYSIIKQGFVFIHSYVRINSDLQIAMVAIARRRKLLNDEVIVSLADSSWEILDLSGSDVSDIGLAKVAEICKFLRAVDIRCEIFSSLLLLHY